MPQGFGPPTLVSGPAPLEDAELVFSIPGEAWLHLSSLASIEMIMVRNNLKGESEGCY